MENYNDMLYLIEKDLHAFQYGLLTVNDLLENVSSVIEKCECGNIDKTCDEKRKLLKAFCKRVNDAL